MLTAVRPFYFKTARFSYTRLTAVGLLRKSGRKYYEEDHWG